MQKYATHRENLGPHFDCFPPNESARVVYLASDVDARIAELEKALRKSGHLQIFTESTHCHVNGLRYAHTCSGCMALANSTLMDGCSHE